ncbi:MAG: flagellar basal body-associated FliL family protein [Kangiellaceae bacterium]|nr:flagellar basal body-associated FliL family protein [Kangiellaceae bacterium]
MAQDDQDLELDVEEGGAEGGKDSKKMIIIIAAAVLLLGGGAAAFFLMGDDSAPVEEETASDEVVEEKAPAIYVGVPNAITANLPGAKKSRTVQIKLSFLVRSTEAKDNVKLHMPQLKNDVLMLLSQKSADELKTPEGFEKLKEETLITVQESLTKMVDDPTVEQVLFVSFVLQ